MRKNIKTHDTIRYKYIFNFLAMHVTYIIISCLLNDETKSHQKEFLINLCILASFVLAFYTNKELWA